MKKILMFVVVLVAFSTLFAQSAKIHMTPKVGIGFGFTSANMLGLTAGFDATFRVLDVKKKPGMALYIGGEADFVVWPDINWGITNFEIPLLGSVRFQLPVGKVFIIPFVQTGVNILFRTGGSTAWAGTGWGVGGTGSASAAFAFNMGSEFVFKKKIVLRGYLKFQGTGWVYQNYSAAFMVDIGYRIAK